MSRVDQRHEADIYILCPGPLYIRTSFNACLLLDCGSRVVNALFMYYCSCRGIGMECIT